MSLVPDYGTDSESSESSNDNEEAHIKTEIKKEDDSSSEEEKKSPAPILKLPPPKFNGTSNTGNSDGLVFKNPFIEEANAKEAILEKHVKMVNTKDAVIINGKKICWNYRKGRCRFGHNCKYAHDSDLQKSQAQLDEELEVAKAKSVVCQSGVISPGQNPVQNPFSEPSQVDNEQLEGSQRKNEQKRKRPGLSQGLVPGKKVMKQYLSSKK